MADWYPIYKYPNYKAVGSPIPQEQLEKIRGWLGHLSSLAEFNGKINFISNTMKWPDTEEMFWELLNILLAHPQLDVMIAVLYCEAGSVVLSELELNLKKCPDFISIDFWVHDYTIEILNPSNAKQKLIEYESRSQACK